MRGVPCLRRIRRGRGKRVPGSGAGTIRPEVASPRWPLRIPPGRAQHTQGACCRSLWPLLSCAQSSGHRHFFVLVLRFGMLPFRAGNRWSWTVRPQFAGIRALTRSSPGRSLRRDGISIVDVVSALSRVLRCIPACNCVVRTSFLRLRDMIPRITT